MFILSALIFLVCALYQIINIVTTSDTVFLIGPLLVYVFTHILRAIRLGVLLASVRARHLLILYLYTAACALVIPFNLGELVRLNEIACFSRSYGRALLIVWIERLLDVIALGILAFFVIYSGYYDLKFIHPFLWKMTSFIGISVTFFFIVPEQLSLLNLHVMRSYKGAKAVYMLRLLDSFSQIFEQVRPLLTGKFLTVSMLTLLIWAGELLAMIHLLNFVPWQNLAINLVQEFSWALNLNWQEISEFGQLARIKLIVMIVFGVFSLLFYYRLRMKVSNGNK